MPEPYYDDGRITLYCGDCREILPSLGLADAVVTDPPYGDTSLEWDRPVTGWMALLIPHLKASASVWCFGSFRFFMDYRSEFAGWNLAQEIVWKKHTGTGIHNDRFRRVHELAAQYYLGAWGDIYKDVQKTMLYGSLASNAATRGNVPAPHLGKQAGLVDWSSDGERIMTSVIEARTMHRQGAVHPTQKPTGILRPLIQYSCPPDGVVLDLFAGSGSTLVAARDLGRRAIGIEAREDYCEAAVKRFAQGVLAA